MQNIGRKEGVIPFIIMLTIVSNVTVSSQEIQYFDVTPSIQEEYRYVKFYCIIDPINIRNIFVDIISPRGIEFIKPMIWNEIGVYINYSYFNESGKYSFFITVVYENGVRISSTPKYFWITIDVNDIDNDGIPNWWEEKFYLNPEDLEDALEDYDKDGLTNLEEYKLGLNPWVENTYNIDKIISQVFPFLYAILFLSLIYLIKYVSNRIPWKKGFNIIASLGASIIIVAISLSYIYIDPLSIRYSISLFYYILCYLY